MILNDSVRGRFEPTRTYDGHCLGPRSVCSARNAWNPSGSNVGGIGQHQRRHHLIADIGRRDPIHRHLDDIGVAQQHPLDRRRTEVLTVDPHPVAEPAREVREVVLVAVGQVATVVNPTAHPFGVGFRVVVVALEAAGAGDIDQFARYTRRAGFAAVYIDDLGSVGQGTQRSRWCVRCAPDRDSTLGRTEAVDDDRAEPAGEPVDVGGCALIPVDRFQRIVGVVGPLRGGEHVRQRLADVVRIGRAIAANIGKELRCRELAPQHH